MTTATVVLKGEKHVVEVHPGETVLAAAKREWLDVPSLCTRGECGTCIARLDDGRVEMRCNHVLDDEDLAGGYILTCQSLPLTDTVTVVYE